jgi:murein DD-endopeptidase MepM/ murein hydrolase activator NlpD
MNLCHARYRPFWPPLALFLGATLLLAGPGCAAGPRVATPPAMAAAPVATAPVTAAAPAAPATAPDPAAAPAPVTTPPAPASGPAPRWPLDLPAHWLTSDFMEYRDGRFHAGLDFKTREQEGFPAFAVADGWISRLRASPVGYGRAAYLSTPDGHIYVYAHLGRFADRLERVVREAQARDGRYRVELELPPGALPLKRGEVVGLVGQSGTGGPHLHFEVRDAQDRPLDPLRNGFAVCDTIAPVIAHVRALPAAPAARLEGGAVARKLAVAGQAWANGQAPVLHVAGPVAFSAQVVDATDPAGHRLEPWRLELTVDGRTVFRRDNEWFDYAQNVHQRLEWTECGGLREEWLHRDPADSVAGREGDRWYLGADGQGLAPGRHALALAAIDRAGNRATVAWDLEVAATPGPAPADGPWRPEPVAVSVTGAAGGEPVVLTPFFASGPDPAPGVALVRLEPGADGALLAPVTLARAAARCDTAQAAQAARQGLRFTGPVVRWEAAAWPVAGAPLVAVPEAAAATVGAPAVLWFRWDGAAWSAAGPLLAPAPAGGPPRLALPRPGLYAALRDTVPPVIAAAPLTATPHPGYGGAPQVTPPRWSVLAVGVRDAGAGVVADSLRARWDGRRLIVEPDLPRDRVLVELPDDAAPGRHTLELEAVDAAGRRAVSRLTVQCRAAAGGKPGRAPGAGR